MNNVYIHSYPKAYPDHDFVHMINGPKVHDFVYDESFPYRLKDPKSKFLRFLARTVILIIVKPFCFFRYCLRIKGRRNIRVYRKLAGRKAMISVCNHTTEWDTLLVMCSRPFKFSEFPIWQEGAESKSGDFYRISGGIVLPTKSYKGMNYAYEAMREVVKENKWLHAFPEAACWPYFPGIRSFRTGLFKLAMEENLPVLPMVVKYRRPNFLWRIFKKQPNAKLIIGHPVMADPSLEGSVCVNDFTHRTQVAMMNLLGLDEKSNKELIDSLPKYHVEPNTFLK